MSQVTDAVSQATSGVSQATSGVSQATSGVSQATSGVSSGVATPGHTRASAHVKFAGARVKIMWKAKVKDQVLGCAIASFMWT